MTRERWFCYLCGALTTRIAEQDGRVYCRAHSSLLVDVVPPDPFESLPMQAAQLREDAPPHKERMI